MGSSLSPPALLASAALHARPRRWDWCRGRPDHQAQISDVENSHLPPGSSGIVAIVEERWVTKEMAKALAKAEKAEHHHAH